LNKAFRRSEKIYVATAAAVAYLIAAAHLEQALQDVREAWNKEAAKVFLEQKYDVALGTLRGGVGSVLSDTALTAENVYGSIVNDRSALVGLGAQPDALIVSPATYAFLLQSPEFVRASDLAFEAAASGIVGRVAGLNVYEYQGLPTDTAIGGANYDVEYYMYDADAFSIVTNVEVLRLIDSERFSGSLAQVEIVSGMALTNPERALIKIKASA
jgi:hypothetical protein